MPIIAHKTTSQLPLLGSASSRLCLLLFFGMVTIRDIETSGLWLLLVLRMV